MYLPMWIIIGKTKYYKGTYQDGTAVGLNVDKERGGVWSGCMYLPMWIIIGKTKYYKGTYQDGTAVGLNVDKEGGCLEWMRVLTIVDNNRKSQMCQPNVPSSNSPRTSTTSTTSNVPATPRPPIPSTSQTTTLTTQGNSTNGNPPNPHTGRDQSDKWVINLSNTPLTSKQLSLLQKGPNFAITPKSPP